MSLSLNKQNNHIHNLTVLTPIFLSRIINIYNSVKTYSQNDNKNMGVLI
jgi:hypothetical protein